MATSFAHVKARLRHLLSDFRRIVEGFTAFLTYLFIKDLVDLSLGQLSAESTVAVGGRANRYVVMISSARTEPQEVTLILDIYAIDSPTHPDGHYAHFSKRLKAQPRAVTRVEIQYDWRTRAGFFVDGTPSPADHLWRGTVDRNTRYSVSAVLSDVSGNRLELLTVYQELTP